MAFDFRQLFNPQTTRYPVSPIATLLQNIFAVQSYRQEQARSEEEREQRRQEQSLRQRLAEQQLAQQQEQTRIRAMTAGQYASENGLRVRPGFENRTLAELQAAGLLNAAFIDPQVEAREQITGAQTLAGLTRQPQTIPGSMLQAAFPRAVLPLQPGGPAPAPGQGIAGTAVETAPLTIGAPRTVTLGELGGPAVRPELQHLPWDPEKPIPSQYLIPQVSPAETRQTETIQRQERQKFELPQRLKDAKDTAKDAYQRYTQARQSGTPAEIQRTAQEYNQYLQDAEAALSQSFGQRVRLGTRIPGQEVQQAAQLATARERRAERLAAPPGGATETLSSLKLGIITGKIDPKKITPEGRKILGITEKGLDPDRAAIEAAVRAATIRVRGLRGRVQAAGSLTLKQQAEANLGAAEGELQAWQQLLFEKQHPGGIGLSPAQGLPARLAPGASPGSRRVQALPDPKTVPVGTIAVSDSGKRYRNDGRRWVPVP